MEVCRYDAIKKREDGVVEIIESKCEDVELNLFAQQSKKGL